MEDGHEIQCDGHAVGRMRRREPIFQMVIPDSCETRSSADFLHTSIPNVLSLVTGGANGLGEHIKSFIHEENHNPNARTKISLSLGVSDRPHMVHELHQRTL